MTKEGTKHELLTLLEKYGYGAFSFSHIGLHEREWKTLFEYVSNTPRVTSIGRTLEEVDAASIVAVTLRGVGGDRLIQLAIRLDCADGLYGKILEKLHRTGVLIEYEDLKAMSDEELTPYAALLHAEEVVEVDLHYHGEATVEGRRALYRFVRKNYTQAGKIMEIAKNRYTLNVDIIRDSLTGAPSLGLGVL